VNYTAVLQIATSRTVKKLPQWSASSSQWNASTSDYFQLPDSRWLSHIIGICMPSLLCDIEYSKIDTEWNHEFNPVTTSDGTAIVSCELPGCCRKPFKYALMTSEIPLPGQSRTSLTTHVI